MKNSLVIKWPTNPTRFKIVNEVEFEMFKVLAESVSARFEGDSYKLLERSFIEGETIKLVASTKNREYTIQVASDNNQNSNLKYMSYLEFSKSIYGSTTNMYIKINNTNGRKVEFNFDKDFVKLVDDGNHDIKFENILKVYHALKSNDDRHPFEGLRLILRNQQEWLAFLAMCNKQHWKIDTITLKENNKNFVYSQIVLQETGINAARKAAINLNGFRSMALTGREPIGHSKYTTISIEEFIPIVFNHDLQSTISLYVGLGWTAAYQAELDKVKGEIRFGCKRVPLEDFNRVAEKIIAYQRDKK